MGALDRRGGRRRRRVELLGQEEGGDAVARVLADDALALDDDAVHRRRQLADQLEVGGARQAARQGARALEVREQHRGDAARRLDQRRHALEHRLAAASDERGQPRRKRRPVHVRRSQERSVVAVQPGRDVLHGERGLALERQLDHRAPEGRRLDRVERRCLHAGRLLEQLADPPGAARRVVGDVGELGADQLLARLVGDRRVPRLGVAQVDDVAPDPDDFVVGLAQDGLRVVGHPGEPPVGVPELRAPARSLQRVGDCGKSWVEWSIHPSLQLIRDYP